MQLPTVYLLIWALLLCLSLCRGTPIIAEGDALLRKTRHIGIGGAGVFGGAGLVGGGFGGGYGGGSVINSVPVISTVPVITQVPVVVQTIPSYGYEGLGGGFGNGGFGAGGFGGGIVGGGVGFAKFKGFGFGAGLLG